MKTSIFYKKRKKAKIEPQTMAKELGISIDTYKEIESGARPMPSNLMGKFFDFVNKAKSNPNMVKLKEMEENQNVNIYYDELVENNKAKLKEMMKKFNIDNYGELSTLLGYNSRSVVSLYTSGNQEPTNIFKQKLYDFFTNELNIQVKSDTTPIKHEKKEHRVAKGTKQPMSNEELKEINEFLFNNNMSRQKFADKIGMAGSSLSHYLGGRPIKLEEKEKIFEFLEKSQNEELNENEPKEKIETSEYRNAYSNFKEFEDTIHEDLVAKVIEPVNYVEIPITEKDIEQPTENTFEDLMEQAQSLMEQAQEMKRKQEEEKNLTEFIENLEKAAKFMGIIKKILIKEGFSQEFAEKFVFNCLEHMK